MRIFVFSLFVFPFLLSAAEKNSQKIIKRAYDETRPNTTITLDKKGAYKIFLSRNTDFKPVYLKTQIKDSQQIKFKNLLPGTWYLKVVGQPAQMAQQFEIQIAPAQPLDLKLTDKQFDLVSKNPEKVIDWQTDKYAAYYELQMAYDKAFATVSHRLATQKNKVNIAQIPQGSYYIRLGGFNLRSGKWEYTKPIQATLK